MQKCLSFLTFVATVFSVSPLRTAAVSVHPIWGAPRNITTTQQQVQQSQQAELTGESSSSQESEAARRSESFRSRVCARVQRRFADDAKVLERVNRRLLNRFDFSCSFQISEQQEEIEEDSEEVFVDGVILNRPDDDAVLTVALDPFNPPGASLPKGASNVRMLSVNLSASCDRDITIAYIEVSDMAPGRASDVSAVWMSIDGERVSRTRPLTNDKTAKLNFRRAYVIPACRTVTVDFFEAFTLEALASTQHALSIELPNHIYADADVQGEFPFVGKRFRMSTQETGTVRIMYLPVEKDAQISGSQRQIIGRFSLSVDDKEDQVLHSMTIENDAGAHDGDFVGIYARSSSGRARFTDIAPFTYFDQITLHFDPPYQVLEGESVDFDIIADVVNSTGGTIRMRFEEQIDFYSVGSLSGFGNTGQQFGSRIVIEGGPDTVRIR